MSKNNGKLKLTLKIKKSTPDICEYHQTILKDNNECYQEYNQEYKKLETKYKQTCKERDAKTKAYHSMMTQIEHLVNGEARELFCENWEWHKSEIDFFKMITGYSYCVLSKDDDKQKNHDFFQTLCDSVCM